MKVLVDESCAGSGKTQSAIERIVSLPCKVLFITERKDSFAELDGRFRKAARKAKTDPVIRHIHSGNHGGRGVVKRIAELPDDYRPLDHVIVIATHEALLRSDFNGFHGWRIVIDEVPRFLDFQEKHTPLDAAFFQRHYTLTGVADGWSIVDLTSAGRALAAADVRNDDSHSHLDLFHARVLEAGQPNGTRMVMCNLPDWSDMKGKKVTWCWASVFSLRALEAFDRIELLGNRFSDDIGSRITSLLDRDDVEWEPLPPLPPQADAVPRAVTIHFFSDRPSSKVWFGSDNGQQVLREIGQHLSAALPPEAIWTANENGDRDQPAPKEVLALDRGTFIKPKQAGTNQFRKLHHAAMIYAAKPCRNLLSLLKLLGISPHLWTQSIEFETILQFATRTSVRDPDSTMPVSLWVFDREQALHLEKYFAAQPHITASLVHVPLAIDIPAKQKGGRPSVVRTPAQEAAVKAERRRRDTDRKRRSRRKDAARTLIDRRLNR